MNLYWPVYKRIEQEVMDLAYSIHFSDDQLSVYSVNIANLIIRCAVEIESISKELYCQQGGNMQPKDDEGKPRDLYFDTDCIKLLNEKWKLEKKAVSIVAPNMHFVNHVVLHPLKKAHKRGSSGSKWKRSYQALKHDRQRSINKGTVEALLDVLGALYILNIYYANVDYYISSEENNLLELGNSFSSGVFKAQYSSAINMCWNKEMDDNNIIWDEDEETPYNLEESMYILKIRDEDYRNHHNEWCYVQRKRELRFWGNKKIKRYLREHPEDSEQSMEEICLYAGGLWLANEIMGDREVAWRERPKIQVIVNKHGEIYPHLHLSEEDICNIDEVIADEYYYQPVANREQNSKI